MAIQHLIKGEPDWHKKINDNFDQVHQDALETAKEVAANDKVPKPVAQTLEEGYLYQNSDGTTKLTHPGNIDGRFKYSFIMDNGIDGTPTAIEYADDAYGMTAALADNVGDWGNTALYQEYFKPCVIKPGATAPEYYLRKDNYNYKEDNTPSVLTGADGDVMIEVKKLYGRFVKTNDGKLKVSIMNWKEADDCICFTEFDGVEQDVMYRGAYKAGVATDATTVLRSISGVAPLVSKTRANFRTYANNRGDEYFQNEIYLLFLWQAMYLLMYKNRNSQTALGKGRTGLTWEDGVSKAEACGYMNDKPFCYGDQTGTMGVKFLGVEDFFGNVWEMVDGCTLVNNVYKLTRYKSRHNDTGANAEYSLASGLSAADGDHGKYLQSVQGTNEAMFLPAEVGASSGTYFCDYFWVADATQIVFFGGYWYSGAGAGAFFWVLHYGAGIAYSSIGSRLCRKKIATS